MFTLQFVTGANTSCIAVMFVDATHDAYTKERK